MRPWTPSGEMLALHAEHTRLQEACDELNMQQARDYIAGHLESARALANRLHELRNQRWRARERLVAMFKREALGDDRP